MKDKYKESPLGSIPAEWNVVKIEELALDRKGAIKIGPFGSQLKKSELVSEGIKVYGQENVLMGNFEIGNRYISQKKYQSLRSVEIFPDDVLISMMGSVGYSKVFPEDAAKGIMDSHLIRIQVVKKKCNPVFLSRVINDSTLVMGQIKAMSQGAIMSGLNSQIIKNIRLPLPSLLEQRKIIEIILNIDKSIQKADEAIANTERTKKGLMHELLTKGIGHKKFRDSEIGRIPEDWDYGKIEEFSRTKDNSVQTGPFGAQLHAYDYVKEGVPLILIQNVVDGRINENGIPRITESKANKLSRYKVKPGDIVFSRVGSVGRSAVIKEHHDGWMISGQMLRVRLENPQIDNDFLSYIINTKWFMRALGSRTVGATRKSINTEILSNLPLVVPSLLEQHKIVRILSSVDKKLAFQRRKKVRFERVKRGMMNDLLTGKRRVKVGG